MEHTISLFNKVLEKCTELGASDVHLCVGTSWKYRLHGLIVPVPQLKPLSVEESEIFVRHILKQSRVIPENGVDADHYGVGFPA
jgi:Tfp pilus assembly pilus retraction ATPase PilT